MLNISKPLSRHSKKLFAYDTKSKQYYSQPEASENLQEDVDHVQKWSDISLLYFSAGKCKSMHIGKVSLKHQYKTGEVVTESICLETVFGVLFDDDFRFHEYKAAKV